MTALTENPAVVAPHKVLTPSQQSAVGCIAFFRSQVRDGNGWRIGNKRFSGNTIAALQQLQLVRKAGSRLELTQGGALAADRLKRGTR